MDTMTNLMELRHHTMQHSGCVCVCVVMSLQQEVVFCFPLLSAVETIQACDRVKAKWAYLTNLEHFRCSLSGNKGLKQRMS